MDVAAAAPSLTPSFPAVGVPLEALEVGRMYSALLNLRALKRAQMRLMLLCGGPCRLRFLRAPAPPGGTGPGPGRRARPSSEEEEDE